jgi:ERCC4-related helicase
MRALVRGDVWEVKRRVDLGDRLLLKLGPIDGGEEVEVLSPPDEVVFLASPATNLERKALVPYGVWRDLHEALRLSSLEAGEYAAFHSGRIQPEPYQFAPVAKLMEAAHRNLLIADDVGLGKTIEAGICLFELIARGVGRRILLVVPPGLIPQWLDEMRDKFGLVFQPIENASSLDSAQTSLSEGVQPWAYFERVITSTEYLKRRDVHVSALARPWDVIVVDEAHYLAESGSPTSPYSTLRSRLGPRLREASRSLILLTATPHNGYRHSFRSLLELVEPTEATLGGTAAAIERRIGRTMVRRMKRQITKAGANGEREQAFPPRMPVERIEVGNLSREEIEIFSRVSTYCARTIGAAEGSEDADLVSFAMQIIKKRMLSSRRALQRTIANRLEALNNREAEEPPSRSELLELQSDLPLGEDLAERTSLRILRTSLSRDAKRRSSEKKQLKEIQQLLNRIGDRSDPKIDILVAHLERGILGIPGEKAIVFTEYRDTLEAIRSALTSHPSFQNAFTELTGGLSGRQRTTRIARFLEADCLLLIATDAASEGLNLQEQCRRIYHFELPWNPNRLEQRNGRIDRHGQTRSPIISYLFYPDSPEDGVLDRLIQRISTMRDDKVATPDILGILSEVRIEEALTRIDGKDAAEGAARSILGLFEEQREEFARTIAPLLLAGSQVNEAEFRDWFSADPMLMDDEPFERFMLRRLGSSARKGTLPHTYGIEVPSTLQGRSVVRRYEAATFRRSVAVRCPAAEVEFIHRLHPLFRAIAEDAYRELTMVPSRGAPGARIAVRRHRSIESKPIAIFTFFERFSRPDGSLLAVGLSSDGEPVPDAIVETILRDVSTAAGEVKWEACEEVFGNRFEGLIRASGDAVRERLRERASMMRAARLRKSAVLRNEAELYKRDRLAEIDQEEKAERSGTRAQISLFRDVATNWKARRAAVETHYVNRLRAIDTFEVVEEPSEPQPLAVLLVLPES